MRIVLQRVSQASVTVDGAVVGEIGPGFVALLGAGENDTREIAAKMAEKISKLRVFADENGKTNLSQADVGGEILVISQFTLYADCRKGNRPGFTGAGSPRQACELYEYFADVCEGLFARAARGVFGAMMSVSLVNDGPFTVILDSGDLGY
ncbi:MAG: D-aminoacyl-tRNA deacylase [Defluviitaleaceae bacterium]|nr:D-aminoacyl-tRNA deacylase [Defluviitaleaceae bacterium]MCL2835117.1 D-aminoacyl-tRNA deacylase [Defluviitaleaceae bacterium]